MEQLVDLAIIGGGINGCGCAADAALRGLSVILFEKDDIASGTSSSSTKLIHGGLRYLEQYEFNLVKKALIERQRLLELAPHLIRPQLFVLPYQTQIRASWFIRLGLFLYDHLSGKNRLPKCKTILKHNHSNYFQPLNPDLSRGFLFYDAATDDSRLTMANALLAKQHGASIRRDSSIIQIEAKDKVWQLTVLPKQGPSYKVQAKAIINAAGPWIESIDRMLGKTSRKMSMVQGSHLIVPKMYEGSQAYLLQAPDKRVVFVIPYQGFTLIGTTEVRFQGSLDEVKIHEEEMDYLIDLVNSYFESKLTKQTIIHSWSGVRPLLAQVGKSMRSLSRDYCFEVSKNPLPQVTIYSGKLTTYRQLAEEILDQLAVFFPNSPACQTRETSLPGSNLGSMNFAEYVQYANKQYAWLGTELLERYLNTYGTCMESFLNQCTDLNSMGKRFGESLYQVEVDYLLKEEFAKTCDDLLKRRTKLFLTMDKTSQNELNSYLNLH